MSDKVEVEISLLLNSLGFRVGGWAEAYRFTEHCVQHGALRRTNFFEV